MLSGRRANASSIELILYVMYAAQAASASAQSLTATGWRFMYRSYRRSRVSMCIACLSGLRPRLENVGKRRRTVGGFQMLTSRQDVKVLMETSTSSLVWGRWACGRRTLELAFIRIQNGCRLAPAEFL
ncbi:hypothetical protein ACQKWADRAFT_307617 [Trichoderma austrokoningii]